MALLHIRAVDLSHSAGMWGQSPPGPHTLCSSHLEHGPMLTGYQLHVFQGPRYPLGTPPCPPRPHSTCSPHPRDTQVPSQVLGKPIQWDRMVGPEFRGRDR